MIAFTIILVLTILTLILIVITEFEPVSVLMLILVGLLGWGMILGTCIFSTKVQPDLLECQVATNDGTVFLMNNGKVVFQSSKYNDYMAATKTNRCFLRETDKYNFYGGTLQSSYEIIQTR